MQATIGLINLFLYGRYYIRVGAQSADLQIEPGIRLRMSIASVQSLGNVGSIDLDFLCISMHIDV